MAICKFDDDQKVRNEMKLTMSSQELADYIRKNDREENRWENLVSNKSINDVDEELLKEYTNQAHEVGRIELKSIIRVHFRKGLNCKIL